MTKQHMNRPYLKFIGYIQVITIFLVVFGHSFHEYPDGEGGASLIIYRTMYSFRMPLFMFVSGFLMAYTCSDKLKQPTLRKCSSFVHSKIKRLMIPFFVLTCVTFIPRSLLSSMSDDAIQMNWLNFLKSFIYEDNLTITLFWFLQSSFTLLVFCFTLLAILNKLQLGQLPIDIVLITGFAILYLYGLPTTVFSLSHTATLGIYFALGIIYEAHFAHIDRLIPWQNPVFLMFCLFSWLILFFLTENTVYIPFCSMMGIAMVISLTKIIEQKNIKVFDKFLGASYMIFLLSWYCNVAFQQILSHFIKLPWYIHSVLSLTTGIVIPWQFYKYLENHQHSALAKISVLLLGQSFRSRPKNKSMNTPK